MFAACSRFARPLIVMTVLLALFGLAPAPQRTAAQSEGFPIFGNQTRILPVESLNFNPTNEIIFPSIIRAADHISNPLGAYYLYYAPHDPPGGISLAYANSPSGPWTEYANNPIISNVWSPHYSVSHVSSPDIVWNPSAGKFYLYFHGENSVTRLATSSDGINFTYDRAVVSTADFNGISEASYARVFRHTMPSRGNTYTMLLMGNNGGTRKIYLAWSNDGRFWTTRRDPFISPSTAEGTQLSSANFFPWNGKYYVVFHTDRGDVYAREVGADFNMTREAGIFYNSIAGAPDDNKASAPEFITVGSTLYMFYATGPRLDSRLAFAIGGTAQPIEIILDNPSASVTGTWVTSTGASGYYGPNYLHDDNAGKGSKSARYTPNITSAGSYEVFVRWAAHSNRASNAPIDVIHSGGTTTRLVNQRINGGTWYSLGTFSFSAGTSGSVLIRTTGTDGYVVADAVRLVKR